jgi:hypothetical protein
MAHPCEHLHFRVGQKVIERYGNDQATAKTCETEVTVVEGGNVMVETGGVYDALTGAAEPKGAVYRSIRGVTVDDKRKAENLLGGVEKGRP